MPIFSHLKPSALKKLYGKIPSFSQTGRYSLGFLNITQFLGVINDNIFKFVMAFLLIDTLGQTKASGILSATGAVYVIPFLLFSSSAGILADRFSKQKLLVVMKLAEIIVMALAIVAFAVKSVFGCYTLLFLLSTHSAMFGPSKYGIIPELVPNDKVSRANGLITSFTYLAIILGTFLASFLTEITNRHFPFIAIVCLVIAAAGFISSLCVKRTPAQGSTKKINFFFVREIYHTLQHCRHVRHLFPAILGSAYFLFIGAFTQLNIIPFALDSLHMSEVAGGYLFLATALGIALGAYLAGKASRKRVELGLSCLSAYGIAICFVLISFFSLSLAKVIACLVMIGLLGGVFIVPFDTFIQLYSADEKRGQTIAAANFLSFTGVLVASFALFLFSQVFDLSSATSFMVVGIITFFVAIAFTFRLSDLSMAYFSRKILQPLCRFSKPDIEETDFSKNTILVMENATWRNAFLLSGVLPNTHFLLPYNHRKRKWYLRMFHSIHHVDKEDRMVEIMGDAKEYLKKGVVPCLFLDKTMPGKVLKPSYPLLEFFTNSHVKLAFVRFEKDPSTKELTLSISKT
jgi:acyl-[acyl-carrier-protein]-phospholipid O-acyltransferase/long-chain-fatty-acid--[acyl-carrier-protein] ligase